MKTNIVVSAVRVNGYWYLRVKYDENNCRVRYQQRAEVCSLFILGHSTLFTINTLTGADARFCADRSVKDAEEEEELEGPNADDEPEADDGPKADDEPKADDGLGADDELGAA